MKESVENEDDSTNLCKSKSKIKWLMLLLASTSLVNKNFKLI